MWNGLCGSSRSVRWMGSRGVSWIERGFAATCPWVADSLCLGQPVCLAFPQRTASHIGASYRWLKRQASSTERWAERRIGKPQALFEILVEDPSGSVLLWHSFSFNNLGSFIFMKYLKDVLSRLYEMNSSDKSDKSDKSNRSKQSCKMLYRAPVWNSAEVNVLSEKNWCNITWYSIRSKVGIGWSTPTDWLLLINIKGGAVYVIYYTGSNGNLICHNPLTCPLVAGFSTGVNPTPSIWASR